MPDGYSLSTDAWDLHRRAERDRARHEDILTASPGKAVRVPIRGLEEFTLDEIAAMVFEDLWLPDLEEKGNGAARLPGDAVGFNTNALRRQARQGDDGPRRIREEDRRYKSWEIVRNAVIFAMRDISGSMGRFEAYIRRAFYFWMLRFLRARYTRCEIVFIACHPQAFEVDEHDLLALGDSGGMRMSSAYALALEMIEKRFNPREWNINPFVFSDGYNRGDQECVALARRLLAVANRTGYGGFANPDSSGPQGQLAPLGLAYRDAFADEPRVVLARIERKEDAWPALRRFVSSGPVPVG